MTSKEILRATEQKAEAINLDCVTERNWAFRTGPVPRWMRRQNIEIILRRSSFAPSWAPIKEVTKRNSWVVYFVYLPTGILTPAHLFTLRRLRDLGLNIFVVFSTTSAAAVPAELDCYADAVYWKAIDGYDFSAYSLALRIISRLSDGADVIVMNDSVFGPFSDIRKFTKEAPWQLTGFTASSQVISHIQSYSFILKNVTRSKMRNLASVFFPFTALNRSCDVIALQETRLARVASRSMSVGAFWFADVSKIVDPTLVLPFELLGAGFPFLKRSLLGKYNRFQSMDSVLSALEFYGHPIKDIIEAN